MWINYNNERQCSATLTYEVLNSQQFKMLTFRLQAINRHNGSCTPRSTCQAALLRSPCCSAVLVIAGAAHQGLGLGQKCKQRLLFSTAAAAADGVPVSGSARSNSAGKAASPVIHCDAGNTMDPKVMARLPAGMLSRNNTMCSCGIYAV